MSALHLQIRRCLLAFLALGPLAACDNPAPDDDLTAIHAPAIVRIVPAQQAIAGAHIPTLDPSPMNDAEIRKAIGTGPRCEFHYTRAGRPVLAVSMQPDGPAAGGVVKVSGNLVLLTPASVGEAVAGVQLLLRAEPIRIAVAPVDRTEVNDLAGSESREADMVFEIGKDLRAGYRGYLSCASEQPVVSLRP